MKRFINNFGEILFAILEILIGIVILVKPVEFANLILNCLGIFAIFMGVINCIAYFRSSREVAILEQSLVKGILGVIAGTFLIKSKDWILSILPVVSIIYGIIILFGGIRKIQVSIDLKRLEQRFWIVPLIEAIISILLAIIIFKNPFVLAKTLWIFIGISVIFEGIFNVVSATIMYSVKDKFEI